MALFRKILIANRGEIALRIARTCRDLGIATVAVFSDADRKSVHVLHADEAYRVGPAAASESYLVIDRILDIAEKSGSQAIHPGYGFVAENAEFAEACACRRIKFIGPSAASIRMMGDKTAARRLAQGVHVPLVPGALQPVAMAEAALAEAQRIGFPVMLKAAAGGGGKGMRIVVRPEDIVAAFDLAASEALRAFGDGSIYLERALDRPRHIEVQLLGDEAGNLVYLGERECSLQRRHQKVLEETPSPFVDEDLRRELGTAAVRAAKAAGYYGAGTVEFLVDEERNFYFLEMNTRLQVEHPVTEMVLGIDLVEQQIRIAAGERLAFSQNDVQPHGHAIECRIYAEDPENGFLPSPGTITRLRPPAGPGIREDSGVYEGWTVPTEYDPLLSKLIASGENRQQALARLRRAIDEYELAGIRHNLPLFRRILRDDDFLAGRFDTGYIQRLLQNGLALHTGEWGEVAAAVAVLASRSHRNGTGKPADAREDAWRTAARLASLQ